MNIPCQCVDPLSAWPNNVYSIIELGDDKTVEEFVYGYFNDAAFHMFFQLLSML